MYGKKQPDNQERLEFLQQVLNANDLKGNKMFKLYYTLSLVRFGSKIPVLFREPAKTNIIEEIAKYTAPSFKPDFIVVEVFTGISRKVKKPIATVRFSYTY